MSADQATLSFLPWVRQGLAASIATPDTLGLQPAVTTLSPTLTVNGTGLSTPSVRLRGPVDVLGIDPNQIIRTDPRPNTIDFEPNCLAAIEFDSPDLPWLFTPAAAGGQARLRPWLCLVVVPKQDGVTVGPMPGSPLPVLQITAPAKPLDELPNLQDNWAWAHSQAVGTDVTGALDGGSQLSLSRLISPRILAADTSYIACVVPAFDVGRRIGLGQTVQDSEVTGPNTLTPAWPAPSDMPPGTVQLPVYFRWEFGTGPAGDFLSLASRLQPAAPAGFGSRTVDISHPGFPFTPSGGATATVMAEGALRPVSGGQNSTLWSDSNSSAFETGLAAIVNQPGLNQVTAPNSDPLLAPPIYGHWQAGRATVSVGASPWLDELNLDPRWRVAAAMGTRIIQQQQESLMASAWEQLGEAQTVNQRQRQLQLSLAAGESLYARHLSPLTEEQTLRVVAPAFSRLRMSQPGPGGTTQLQTLTAIMSGSSIPVPATRAAMRRIGRLRGPLTRRLATQQFDRWRGMTWVATLNMADQFPVPPSPPPFVYASMGPFPDPSLLSTVLYNRGFQIAPEGAPLIPLPTVDLLPADWDYPGFFRAAAVEHLQRIRNRPVHPLFFLPLPMPPTKEAVLQGLDPASALSAVAAAAIATGDQALPAAAPGVTPTGLETVMASPTFPQPMYEPLKQLSQDLLLPGLSAMPPDSVVGLETNQAFVNAYMVGLNSEMGRELLWRGYPTDQQGTYFRQFWAYDNAGTPSSDIDDLLSWGNRALDAPKTNSAAAQFVFLMRSSLLRRYPNALVYLTKPSASPAVPDQMPLFSGYLDPDVAFFGFGLSVQDAASYSLALQEHPTEARFGLEVDQQPPNATYLSANTTPPGLQPPAGLTWGYNSAHIAGITHRLPARVLIPVSQLISAS